mmetsp:Transcript_12514/g.19692  ORF Transcript_12514/g.19692 Transcript_12514/m.19692 type:complete len:85 (-) Transcript_12514:755-1009(-)
MARKMTLILTYLTQMGLVRTNNRCQVALGLVGQSLGPDPCLDERSIFKIPVNIISIPASSFVSRIAAPCKDSPGSTAPPGSQKP